MQYIENENVYIEDLSEHPKKTGHYLVPGFSGVWVTKSGRVYSDYKNDYLFVHMTKNGYPTVRIAGQNRYLHILLATTFIKKPQTDETLWVNHRDGDKHNFALSNLEWNSPSGNLIHAFKNDLRTDNKAVLLKDLATGEIKEFSGLNECARSIGKSQARLSMYLNGKNETPLYGMYDLAWKHGKWNNFTKEDLNRVRKGVPRPMVVENLVESTVTIYRSAAEASQVTGVCRTDVITRANGKRSPVVKGYRFVWLHEWVLKKSNTVLKAT